MKLTKTVAGVNGIPFTPVGWIALLGTLLLSHSTWATEPKQQGSAAWALALAKQRQATVVKTTTKTCSCSSQCVCGCNTGAPCRCSESQTIRQPTTTGCRIVNGVMVCPGK